MDKLAYKLKALKVKNEAIPTSMVDANAPSIENV